MPVVKTSSKGQSVIPAEIRHKLGIKPGQKVNLTLVEGKAMISPLQEDPIRALRGVLEGKPSMTKELLQDRKKEIEREEKNHFSTPTPFSPGYKMSLERIS
jgi:AbrB family looped-hinge helix DNA binding protein